MKNFSERMKRIRKEDWTVALLWLLTVRHLYLGTIICGAVIAGYFVWKFTRPLNYNRQQ